MDRDTQAPPFHRRITSYGAFLLASLTVGWASSAQALGLGAPQVHSSLGQTLVLSFPLSLRAGESLSVDCVFAEVTAGTVKLAPSKISVKLEGESETALRAIRVLSSESIEEPILNVSLSLGCPTRLTRQFSALMDPPSGRAAAAPEAGVKVASPRVLSPALQAALATSEAKPRALMGANEADALGSERLTASKAIPGSASSRVPKPTDAPEAGIGAQTSAIKAKDASRKQAAVTAGKAGEAGKVGKAGKSERAAILSAAEPQLRLEAFEPNPAAANPSVAASAAEAAMARLQAVESGLLGLQKEYRSNALKLSALRQDAAAAPAPASEPPALAWGLGALALLLGGVLAVVWRGRPRQQPGRDSSWWGQEAAAENVGTAPASSLVKSPGVGGPSQPVDDASSEVTGDLATRHDDAPAQPELAGPSEHTIALPHSVEFECVLPESVLPAESPDTAPSGLARISQLMSGDLSLEPLSVQLIDPVSDKADAPFGALGLRPQGQDLVSVEELIDLEQQVDFFLVLGQDEAAVDLLHAQLINSGAQRRGSTLPYLKLMEICQQRGDALAFADIAGRYAVQFDAVPPAWEMDLALGQGLDAYEEVITGLQSRWSDSGASMAAVQKLLSNFDSRSSGFDLPALRDLLLLYSVARDRSEHEVRGEEIDLFLPLEPGANAANATGFDLMATMVWQGKPDGAAAQPLEVDILLDGTDLSTDPSA